MPIWKRAGFRDMDEVVNLTNTLESMKVPLEADFKALEDLVASEKAKKEKKVWTDKSTKKTAPAPA